jgi:3'-phosphoadenosine 5'-phosphosulfate sulfotransferase (PAPS reductase)/FAD synthetase
MFNFFGFVFLFRSFISTQNSNREDQMCISFNGGKDCTVVLHMIRLALPTTFRKVRLLYFRAPDEFEEIVTFVHQLVEEYQLTLHEYVSMPIKQGLQEFLAQVHPRRSKRQDFNSYAISFSPSCIIIGLSVLLDSRSTQ